MRDSQSSSGSLKPGVWERGDGPRIARVETFIPRVDGGDLGYADKELQRKSTEGTSPEKNLLRAYRGHLIAGDVESLMVKITCDDGRFGWGEAQVAVGPRVAKQIVDELFGPLLIKEDALATATIWDKMYGALHDRGHTTSFVQDAMSAVDIALWDLKGRLVDQPIHKLLGGAYRKILPTVRFDGSPEDPPQRLAHLAQEAKARGFTAVKFWLGRGVSEDAELAAAVRSAVGPELDLTIYCHEVYTVDQAIALGRLLERIGKCALQIPIDHEDVEGLRLVSQSLDLRVADGECRRGRQSVLPLLLNRAVDLLIMDTGRAGGITEARRIFDLADAFHTPYGIHGGTALGPYLAANLQIAAVSRNFTWIDYSDALHKAANLVLRSPIEWRDGGYVLPLGPGLGIEVNESRVGELCTKHH